MLNVLNVEKVSLMQLEIWHFYELSDEQNYFKHDEVLQQSKIVIPSNIAVKDKMFGERK